MARIYLDAEFVILAMLSFVITPALVYYSSEVKPYCSDVFFLLLSYVVIAAPCLKGLDWKKVWSAGALGALIIWFSYPAIYILFGIGGCMLLASVIAKDRPRSLKWGVILCCWLGSFFLYYIFVLHNFSHVGKPGDFWESGFISFDGQHGSLKVFKDIFKYPLGICHQTWLAWVFLMAGGCFFFKKDKLMFFILAVPVLLVFLASGLHLYSWRGRLVLFLVPILLLMIINGIGMVAATTGKWQRITACLLTGFLFYGSFVTTCANFLKPQEKQDIGGAIIYAKEHMKPGDVLYVDDGAAFVFEYYHSERGLFTGNYIKEVWAGGQPPGWADELKKMQGFKRVWMLFPHQWGPGIWGMNGEEYSLDRLVKSKGRALDSFSSAWASVYAFDLRP